MAYVYLAQAKAHLRIDGDDSNADVLLKMDQATAIVQDYLKSWADEDWTETTVPGVVQAATLLVLTHLYEHRGENMQTDDLLWQAVGRLLARYRDPAYA